MRATTRLLANVKYLSPGAPTGLAGVFTHPAPRSTLLYLYHNTLTLLNQFPEHSVYRQSVEALTKHRLAIVESVQPAGLQEWQDRTKELVDAHPTAFRRIPSIADPNKTNIIFKSDELVKQDDGPDDKAELEGPRSFAAKKHLGAAFKRDARVENEKIPHIEPEPSLTAEQVESIEQQVASGLIEEIINVAEGELNLAATMMENQVWDDLVEAPVEGQWDYHAVRADTHVPVTQAPR